MCPKIRLGLGALYDPRDYRLDALVRGEDDPLSWDNSSQPRHDALVEPREALALNNLQNQGRRKDVSTTVVSKIRSTKAVSGPAGERLLVHTKTKAALLFLM